MKKKFKVTYTVRLEVGQMTLPQVAEMLHQQIKENCFKAAADTGHDIDIFNPSIILLEKE